MTKVAMIGCGKLGLPCAEVMSEHYDVIGYDTKKFESAKVSYSPTIEAAVKDRDLIFIAVPTPHDKKYGGESPITDLEPKDFDYSIVSYVLEEVSKFVNKDQLVVLISTVLPGTTRNLLRNKLKNGRFIYNPYLIAMGSVEWDMVNPECLIIGTEDGTVTGDAKALTEFYKPIMKNDPPINIGTWDEAEAIKIFYNTFISLKISFVNMIQDVAELSGNINVDVVTKALMNATQRITGKRYLTAGMGDAGACHPRDNIALRFMSQRLNMGYDLFHAVMSTRDHQAKLMAIKLVSLARENNFEHIVIHGKAYKPYVEYTDGSYSLLVGYYLEEMGYKPLYVDPLTHDELKNPPLGVYLMAHSPETTYLETGVKINENAKLYCPTPSGSIILDPWRKLKNITGVQIIHYGNTRIN